MGMEWSLVKEGLCIMNVIKNRESRVNMDDRLTCKTYEIVL